MSSKTYTHAFTSPLLNYGVVDIVVRFECKICLNTRTSISTAKEIIERHFVELLSKMSYESFYTEYNTAEKTVERLFKPISQECRRKLITLEGIGITNIRRSTRKYLGPRNDK